jgi:polyhydroxybutyrate depolymerase
MTSQKILIVILLGLGVAVGAILWTAREQTGEQIPPERTSTEETVDLSGKQTYHLPVDGSEREFIVYRPANLSDDAETPVVFFFHGSGGTGEKFYETSGWKEKADEEGFVAVFPTALKYHIFEEEKVLRGQVEEDVAQFQTKWVTYGLSEVLDPAYPNQQLADDVGFVRAMVDFLNENYPVDETRFYASGFSNGAGFTLRLMAEMSDVFAAFAPTSGGTLNLERYAGVGFQFPDSFVPRPVIHLLGSDDPKLVYAAGVESFPTDESVVDPDSVLREFTINGYLTALDLSDAYAFEDRGRVSSFVFDEPADGSESDAVYVFLIADGMKHVYPNGQNYPVVAVDIYWEFFERYSL